jgi:hypothetical protein
MSLIGLIVVLALVGLAVWAVNAYIPMEANIKKILNVVVIIVVILWLLSVFGILGNINAIHVGRIN